MFSFRRDKVGFFATLILILIAASTLISTLVLVLVGLASGDWKRFSLPMKIVLACAWVLCIVVVFTRVAIFRAQMLRAEQARLAALASREAGKENASCPLPPLPAPEADREHATETDPAPGILPRDRPEHA